MSLLMQAFLAMAMMLSSVPAEAASQVSTTYNSGGSYTVPAGITVLKVELWGGGGGGATSPGKGGGGGGGGAYVVGYVTVTPGNTYTVTVGAGGIADANGTASCFDTCTRLQAGGGAVGGNNSGGNGGTASGTSLSSGNAGCRGGDGAGSDTGGGGGGGSPPACTVGATSSGATGGAGGTGQGVGGAGGDNNTNGSLGAAPGGGGGGNGKSKSGGAGGAGRAIITYNFPLVSIAGASILEGDSGTKTLSIPVTVSNPNAAAVTLNYSFNDGTATGGASCITGIDYISTPSSVSIAANTTSGAIPVTLCGDTTYEPDETFTVTASSAANAFVTTGTATGTILNDDPATVITLVNASVAEGNSGTTTLNFPIALSTASNGPLVLSYSLTSGTATGGTACAAGVDYINTVANITIPTGQISGSIPVVICGDTIPEPDETLIAQLTNIVSGSGSLGAPTNATGTITNDDGNGIFTITVPHLSAGTTMSAAKISTNAQGFKNASHVVRFTSSLLDPASGSGTLVLNGASLPASIILAFDTNNEATFSITFDDVGQLQLEAYWQMSYDTPVPTDTPSSVSGSNTFIAAPASFTVTPSGPYVAGNSFSVSVAAKNASGNTTPNFGKESTTENVTLGHALVGPAGGNDPALTGTTTVPDASFQSGNGAATVSDIKWAEVGDISISATLASGSYLSSGLTATGSTAVGAFKPAYFDTDVTPGTGSFTYSGQPFTVKVTAKNASGGTTLNYKGAYARAVTLSDANSATNNSATLGSFSNAGIAAASFNNGEATATTVTYRLNSKTTGPLELPTSAPLKLRAVDTDGVTSSGHTEGITPIRAGRLRLINFYGSDLLKPRVEYRAEYWAGSRWATNTLDSTTAIVAGNIATGGLAVNALTVLNAGIGFITFNAAAAGSYDIAVDLNSSGVDTSCNAAHGGTAANKPWLQGYWSAPANCGGVAAWAQDPNARIRLGSPKAPYIYMRERY